MGAPMHSRLFNARLDTYLSIVSILSKPAVQRYACPRSAPPFSASFQWS
jgi:hypothetical protein